MSSGKPDLAQGVHIFANVLSTVSFSYKKSTVIGAHILGRPVGILVNCDQITWISAQESHDSPSG